MVYHAWYTCYQYFIMSYNYLYIYIYIDMVLHNAYRYSNAMCDIEKGDYGGR